LKDLTLPLKVHAVLSPQPQLHNLNIHTPTNPCPQPLIITFSHNLILLNELLPKNTPILRRIYTTSIPRVIDVATNHSNVKIFNKPLLGFMTSLIQILITPNPLLIMNLTLIHFLILI
jgi:hypothetical protein